MSWSDDEFYSDEDGLYHAPDLSERPAFSPASRFPRNLQDDSIYAPMKDPVAKHLAAAARHIQELSVLGHRVAVKVNAKVEAQGVVRFVGNIPEKGDGIWVGVELDSEKYGKNYGNVGTKSYFTIEKNKKKNDSMKRPEHQRKYGLFTQPTNCRILDYENLKPGMKVWVTGLQWQGVTVYDFNPDRDRREQRRGAVSNYGRDEGSSEYSGTYEDEEKERFELEYQTVMGNITKTIDELNMDEGAGVAHGTIRFVGQTQFEYGPWVGIEMDDPHYGRNFGIVDGVRYFNCKKNMISWEKHLHETFENTSRQGATVRSRRKYEVTGAKGVISRPRFPTELQQQILAKQVNIEDVLEEECRQLREEARRKAYKLNDVRLKPITERKAYGIFVRPSRVKVDELAEIRRQTKRATNTVSAPHSTTPGAQGNDEGGLRIVVAVRKPPAGPHFALARANTNWAETSSVNLAANLSSSDSEDSDTGGGTGYASTSAAPKPVRVSSDAGLLASPAVPSSRSSATTSAASPSPSPSPSPAPASTSAGAPASASAPAPAPALVFVGPQPGEPGFNANSIPGVVDFEPEPAAGTGAGDDLEDCF